MIGINSNKTARNSWLNLLSKPFVLTLMFLTVLCCSSKILAANAPAAEKDNKARVIGLRYNNVHILQLEKTLTLYQEILGFELVDAEVLGGNLAGMLVLKIKAGDYMMTLTLTPPQFADSLGPVGNTNHNHFMLRVNDIGPIGDRLIEEGYELENENYVNDLYTFFTGPNGEIIGLSSWPGE